MSDLTGTGVEGGEAGPVGTDLTSLRVLFLFFKKQKFKFLTLYFSFKE